jgi:hypothetical protein
MKSQTLSDEEKEKERQRILGLSRLLNRSREFKQVEKRERLVKRLAAKSGQKRVRKPAPKGRAELVARQKKARAPILTEG